MSSLVTDPVPLATVEQMIRRYPELTKDVDPITLAEIMVESTDHIEDRTGRRLAPFTNLICEDRLIGIDPTEYGTFSDIPLDFQGSLGVSYANALGNNKLVRHFFLDAFAPMHPELWTYTIESMDLYLTYGSTQPVAINSGGLVMPPDPTTGHVWLRMGTFAPEGTRVLVTYSGGFTVAIPPSLRRACLFQAAKFLILEAEPQLRSGMDVNEISEQIDMLLGPWVRG